MEFFVCVCVREKWIACVSEPVSAYLIEEVQVNKCISALWWVLTWTVNYQTNTATIRTAVKILWSHECIEKPEWHSWFLTLSVVTQCWVDRHSVDHRFHCWSYGCHDVISNIIGLQCILAGVKSVCVCVYSRVRRASRPGQGQIFCYREMTSKPIKLPIFFCLLHIICILSYKINDQKCALVKFFPILQGAIGSCMHLNICLQRVWMLWY